MRRQVETNSQARSDRPLWRRLQASQEPEVVTPDILLNLFDVVDPPVPVASIASWLGVQVVEEVGVSFSGELRVSADRALVAVNADEPQARRRFTIAHELGHLFLHPGEQHHRDEKFANFNAAELKANQFAAALLMPEWMVWRAIGRHRGIKDLARLFEVSEVAMKYRLKTLGAVTPT